ncbi:hypothetical protein PROFUN_12728 [Planoprotostelium fungivorum]|uniref:Uncharacterized protein n=1 Tax=Planoprotostelium fungivorum TaxID=1890364 RepID=A0A2P6N6H6_9EUKA|nr:hypothetical protein PROFUN_12728 [Planoprotostelium fungivorum]
MKCNTQIPIPALSYTWIVLIVVVVVVVLLCIAGGIKRATYGSWTSWERKQHHNDISMAPAVVVTEQPVVVQQPLHTASYIQQPNPAAQMAPPPQAYNV